MTITTSHMTALEETKCLMDMQERLTRIESQLTEIHEIFCNLYNAYEAMSQSPMFAALVGKLGK